MKRISFISVVLISMTMLFVSCTGADGRDGRDGRDATVCSMSINVTANDWTFLSSGSWCLSLTSTSITQSVVDNGMVLVYMKDPYYYSWKLIPLTYYYTDVDSEQNILYLSCSLETSYYLNGLDIYWTESDFYDGNNPGNQTFRVVILEGSSISKAPIDFADFKAVVKAYNITEWM